MKKKSKKEEPLYSDMASSVSYSLYVFGSRPRRARKIGFEAVEIGLQVFDELSKWALEGGQQRHIQPMRLYVDDINPVCSGWKSSLAEDFFEDVD